MRRLLALLALLAALFAVAACGGDDDGGGLSKDEAVEEINDICADAQEDFDRIEQEIRDAGIGGEIAPLVREAQSRLEEGIEDVEDVDAPDEDKDALDEFIESSEGQAEQLGEAADALEAEDQARFAEISEEADELESQADDAAEEYGIDECIDDENQEDGDGGTGTTPDDGGTTQTKEEVIAEGDRICQEAETAAENVTPPDGVEDYEQFGQETAAIIDNAVAEFRGLRPPPEDQDVFEQYVASLEETTAMLQELSAAGAAGDEAEATDVLESFQELGQRSDDLAREYGFENCGEG